MSKSTISDVRHDLDVALEDVAHQLRRAAEGLSEEAETTVSDAAKAVAHAAQSVRQHAATGKEFADRAVREVKAHPIVDLAAAITAAAALVGALASTRHKAS